MPERFRKLCLLVPIERFEGLLPDSELHVGAHFKAGQYDRPPQGVPRVQKKSIESSRSDARLPGNIVQADVCARSGESLLGNFQNAFAVALCIGAGLTRSGL